MFMEKRFSVVAPLMALVLVLALSLTAIAQTAASSGSPAVKPAASKPTSEPAMDIADKTLSELWGDFLHYIDVARPDVAESYGQAILNRNPKPEDLYRLSLRAANTADILTRGSANERLKPIIEQLQKRIESSVEGNPTDVNQIAASIEALSTGGLKAYENASDRLIENGEYALPLLIAKIVNPQTNNLAKSRIVALLPKLGKNAVNGLSAALDSNNQGLIEFVANALREIPYGQSAPFLKAVLKREGLAESTRAAVEKALAAVAKDDAKKSLAELSYKWADNFYNQIESLKPDMRYPNANVWYWQEGLGLTFKSVPRDIFCDVYAMRLSRLALDADAKFYPAMSLWLSAYLKREAQMPAGAKDTTLPEGMLSARFFALASAPEILQDVLARGMKNNQSAVALGAMEALVRTQGAKSLVAPVAGGAQPLVSALGYSDRNVRFLAAISLASALPDKQFDGSDNVLYVLNEALRLGGKKTALLAITDEKLRNETKDAVRAAGYEVIDQADTAKALALVKGSTAIDVVIAVPALASEMLPAMRKDPLLTYMPVIVAGEDAALSDMVKSDSRIVMLDNQKIADALAVVSKIAASAPLSAEQMNNWTIRAAGAAGLLALTNNSVYDLTRIRPALIDALSSGNVEVQLAVAKALSAMPASEAQQAIAAYAIRTDLDEKVRIEALGIVTASVRKFGNQLAEAQVNSIYDLVSGNASPDIREAAAQAWGCLNLSSEKGRSLILQFSPKD
jgi:hypothetical protein